MKFKFRKNNKILYGQDMQLKCGVPSGIEFEIEQFMKGRVVLTAKGYGDIKRGYGNGKLYVLVESLPSKVRHHFI